MAISESTFTLNCFIVPSNAEAFPAQNKTHTKRYWHWNVLKLASDLLPEKYAHTALCRRTSCLCITFIWKIKFSRKILLAFSSKLLIYLTRLNYPIFVQKLQFHSDHRSQVLIIFLMFCVAFLSVFAIWRCRFTVRTLQIHSICIVFDSETTNTCISILRLLFA